eukprot:TRINITY_DN3228_c0_g1_i1.p1 TRINITY_DN3228_c0_g1~~TRINITY_DN3228_c0_g1_i1.p1  ORF type:complete len:131 (+),score=30.57 TRINITY_DN3228_c0_g1_i1:322-714(+)
MVEQRNNQDDNDDDNNDDSDDGVDRTYLNRTQKEHCRDRSIADVDGSGEENNNMKKKNIQYAKSMYICSPPKPPSSRLKERKMTVVVKKPFHPERKRSFAHNHPCQAPKEFQMNVMKKLKRPKNVEELRK